MTLANRHYHAKLHLTPELLDKVVDLLRQNT